jgi:hypothetical protein
VWQVVDAAARSGAAGGAWISPAGGKPGGNKDV